MRGRTAAPLHPGRSGRSGGGARLTAAHRLYSRAKLETPGVHSTVPTSRPPEPGCHPRADGAISRRLRSPVQRSTWASAFLGTSPATRRSLECVRRAEQSVLKAQSTKSYVAAAGRAEFNEAVEALVLGASHGARSARRVRTAQTPGGCGALRVGAELIRAAAPKTTVHVSDPTMGRPRAASGELRTRARALSLLRHRQRRGALRGHAGAAESRRAGRCRAGACLLPQSDGRRFVDESVEGPRGAVAATAADAVSRLGLPGFRLQSGGGRGRDSARSRQRPRGARCRVLLEEPRPVPGTRRRPHHRQRHRIAGRCGAEPRFLQIARSIYSMPARTTAPRSRPASSRIRPCANPGSRNSRPCATASPTCARSWPRTCGH